MIHVVRSTLMQGEGKKKIHRSNSPHEAKPINTKINYFGGWNRRSQWIYLSTPEPNELLSLLQQKRTEKKRKIESNVKIEFLKIRGDGCLIAKNDGDWNEHFKQISSLTLVLPHFFSTSIIVFSIQPFLLKKNM